MIIAFLSACLGLQARPNSPYARGPIAYPIPRKDIPPPVGKVLKRKSIQTRFLFADGTILSLGSDGHSIFFTLDGNGTSITTRFTIAMIFHQADTTIALSSFGDGIVFQPYKKVRNFSLDKKSLSDQTSFISGILLPNFNLVLGSMQNSLIITTPIVYDSPSIIPIKNTITLNNSPDALVYSEHKDKSPYVYAININQATITEIDLRQNKPGIFQLAGNSIGSFAQNNSILVTTDPRKKAINIMTLAPLVTHIYAPVSSIPRNVCFLNRDTIAVSFPALSKINQYKIDTGDLILEKSYNSINNIYLMNCSSKVIISDGEDRGGIPATQIIDLNQNLFPSNQKSAPYPRRIK